MRNLTIATSVRPGRTAVFVDISDQHWQNTCLRIIEYFNRMWGGAGNIIVPTDGNTISPLFWNMLERFDPDYLNAYRRTGLDIEIEEPDHFEQEFEKQVAEWEKQIGEASHSAAKESIRDNLRHSWLTNFEIAPELQAELKVRLAPFYFEQ